MNVSAVNCTPIKINHIKEENEFLKQKCKQLDEKIQNLISNQI